MSKESISDKLSISPSEEIAALLGNCRDLVMHQRIGEARAVLRATRKIASELSVADDSTFAVLDSSIASKPFSVTSVEIDRVISTILLPPKKPKKS
jgi:hypothetical protein